MAGSTSFGRKVPGGAAQAGYRPLPRLPQPPGDSGYLRLPSGADAPANDASPQSGLSTDWRAEELPTISGETALDRFVDEIDIETWKAQRRTVRRTPWRQISLVAALSFGIGSFVLPGDVNAMIRPILWALSGLALASSFAPKRD
jgi:hypothetical protein